MKVQCAIGYEKEAQCIWPKIRQDFLPCLLQVVRAAPSKGSLNGCSAPAHFQLFITLPSALVFFSIEPFRKGIPSVSFASVVRWAVCLPLEILISPVTVPKRTKETKKPRELWRKCYSRHLSAIRDSYCPSLGPLASADPANPAWHGLGSAPWYSVGLSQSCWWDKANYVKCLVLKAELLLLWACQILLMHLFYAESGKAVKEEVAGVKREAAFSVSENSPDTELGNKNTLPSKRLLEMSWGSFFITTHQECVLSEQVWEHLLSACDTCRVTAWLRWAQAGKAACSKAPYTNYLAFFPDSLQFSHRHSWEQLGCRCTQGSILWHTEFLNLAIIS